ncbi:MAG: nicotinate-nucleotide--dimethylbenzimidazole phosphoribosyltransferase [Negativicoccus succinicivorans]|nr:nicotinate-nucleotide--dimethylbenzimidazole phosphoribosyltransferase [Negativicoccus succinicivorans]
MFRHPGKSDAAVAAAAIAPRVNDYVFASSAYPDPLHKLQLQKLGLQEALHYNFTLAQGLGSTLGLSLLDASLHMLNEMRTFGAAGVAVAEDGPGKGRQRKEVL